MGLICSSSDFFFSAQRGEEEYFISEEMGLVGAYERPHTMSALKEARAEDVEEFRSLMSYGVVSPGHLSRGYNQMLPPARKRLPGRKQPSPQQRQLWGSFPAWPTPAIPDPPCHPGPDACVCACMLSRPVTSSSVCDLKEL